MLASAESAISIHIFPPTWALLPPYRIPLLQLDYRAWGWAHVIQASHWLSVSHVAVYKCHCYSQCVPPSPSPLCTSPFSVSVPLSLFQYLKIKLSERWMVVRSSVIYLNQLKAKTRRYGCSLQCVKSGERVDQVYLEESFQNSVEGNALKKKVLDAWCCFFYLKQANPEHSSCPPTGSSAGI